MQTLNLRGNLLRPTYVLTYSFNTYLVVCIIFSVGRMSIIVAYISFYWATVCKRVRPVLAYRSVCPVCPVCLSVTLAYYGQMVLWIKMKLGTEIGLVPGHTVLDGDPAPPKGHSPQFSAHVCCGQTAGWIKMPLGTEVGICPSHIVLDGDQAVPKKEQSSHQFSAYVCCGQTAGWIKVPLGMVLGLGQATLLHAHPAPAKRGRPPSLFRL